MNVCTINLIIVLIKLILNVNTSVSLLFDQSVSALEHHSNGLHNNFTIAAMI